MLFRVYDKENRVVATSPLEEQAKTIARNRAMRTGEIYGADNSRFHNKSWYGKGGFICNNQYP